jgi:hypothetical protein
MKNGVRPSRINQQGDSLPCAGKSHNDRVGIGPKSREIVFSEFGFSSPRRDQVNWDGSARKIFGRAFACGFGFN